MSNQTPNCIPCGLQTFRRNTYFNGKWLVERDFSDEQAYLVGKDRLHNSLLHGVGTVCGLKVVAHPNPECQDKFVYIEPGAALDCCGRELIVTQRLLVPVLELIDPADFDAEGDQDLFISLCYKESLEEKVPVILPDCDCAEENQAFNRVREGYELRLFGRPAGERLPVRPPLRAKLDWLHTIVLDRQSPRALAADDQLQQVYVAAQAVSPDEGEAGEPGELGARLYAFRADTHDLITAVDGGVNPTDLALTLLGDLIFLATDGLPAPPPEEGGDPLPLAPGIAVYKESRIRYEAQSSAVIHLNEPARLVISPATGALFALQLDSGELITWSEADLRDWLALPDPPLAGPADFRSLALNTSFSQPDGPALRGASVLSITLDGRYIFIVDVANNQVRVVEVATMTELTPLNTAQAPVAVFTSRDSQYLYLLTADADHAILTRYALDTSLGSLQLRPDGRGGTWLTTPQDLAMAANERWAYVLQTSAEGQAQVQTIDVDAIAAPGDSFAEDILGTRENVSGLARSERLAVQGGRLYVAADDESENQPARGLVAILNVEEAACDDLFTNVVKEACPACAEDPAEQCVILAHVPHYHLGQPIKDAEDAEEGDNAIDNFTHRPLVPSTNNIVEVIRCMLETRMAEGLVGPRGPAGESGLPGAPGERGPGITEAEAQPLLPGVQPTAQLVPIAGDPEGDQRLVLGIPTGAPGAPGGRGPGITEAEAHPLLPGAQPTAQLVPIVGDPEGDQRLVLGIPQGLPGQGGDEDLVRIVALSWRHDRRLAMPMDQFIAEFFTDPEWQTNDPRDRNMGFVIGFGTAEGDPKLAQMRSIFHEDKPGDPDTRTRSEVFQLYVRYRDQRGLLCECLIPNALHQPVEYDTDGNGLITAIRPLQNEEVAIGVRLVFVPDDDLVPWGFLMELENPFFRVVFRSDFALDEEDRAIDGNHIGGRLPTGNGRQGTTFESWLTVGG